MPLNDRIGVQPGNVDPAEERLYDQGKVAIIQGVGYPKPNLLPLPVHGHLAHLRAGQGGRPRAGWAAPSATLDPNKAETC